MNDVSALREELVNTYPDGLVLLDIDKNVLPHEYSSLELAYYMDVPQNALDWLQLANQLDGLIFVETEGFYEWAGKWERVSDYTGKE